MEILDMLHCRSGIYILLISMSVGGQKVQQNHSEKKKLVKHGSILGRHSKKGNMQHYRQISVMKERKHT
ncbi:hypothetical protein DF41_02055 [Raoultella planticola]|nr:hypothetical protein DF41_02055 [Raoultella planticola]